MRRVPESGFLHVSIPRDYIKYFFGVRVIAAVRARPPTSAGFINGVTSETPAAIDHPPWRTCRGAGRRAAETRRFGRPFSTNLALSAPAPDIREALDDVSTGERGAMWWRDRAVN
ncbi:hypothetical protein EVAR_98536_1 [Eumeta japonica]|uniref:Uncharacterized protein n=1 Tax=Eumeta variegata TaxID=151549 RepID=A0A4C1YMS7_EUMVA|nr:hypothetical protein EVAR_98536_1 [Eumeta japonica]